MTGSEFDYQRIIEEAQRYASQERPKLPSLPSEEERNEIWERFANNRKNQGLVEATQREVETWPDPVPTHGFNHLRWVAIHATLAASLECDLQGIKGELKQKITLRAWRLGLLHDIGRSKRTNHVERGQDITKQLLERFGIDDLYLAEQVLLHDDFEIEPRNNPGFDIPLFSVYAADHLLWGTEREETKWLKMKKKKIPPEEAIKFSHYQELSKNCTSPNLNQTSFGREVAKVYLKYGLRIAKHVEEHFTV